MFHLFHRHKKSIGHAWEGILWTLQTQPNYRVHAVISMFVVGAGVFFHVSHSEWTILVLVITLGLVIETLNTSLEATANAITLDWNNEIKIAKDAAAAAMLTYAIGASIIAAIIFIPKML